MARRRRRPRRRRPRTEGRTRRPRPPGGETETATSGTGGGGFTTTLVALLLLGTLLGGSQLAETFSCRSPVGQLVGELARQVQERLRDRLVAARPELDWEVEYRVAGTPVDVAGRSADGGTTVLVELEWRRADPADNAAKLFRHLADGRMPDRVVVAHVFTGYYDLARGGVSSKRQNAEFVGRVAADTFERLTYRPVDLAVDPPERGGDLPGDWAEAVDAAAAEIGDEV